MEEYLLSFAEENDDVSATTLRNLLVEIDERCPTSYTSETAKAPMTETSDGEESTGLVPDEIKEIDPIEAISEVNPACLGHGGPELFNWDWSLQVSDQSVGLTDPDANGDWEVYEEAYEWSEGKYKTAFGSAVLGAHPLAWGPDSEAEFMGISFVGWGDPAADCADIWTGDICSRTSWPGFGSEQLAPIEGVPTLRLTLDGFISNPACQD